MFRGPGVRNQFDDSPDEYDPGLDSRPSGGRSGRIILLGDGTELLTDMGDEEMFPNGDESKDIKEEPNTDAANTVDSTRNQREGTPGPNTGNPVPHPNGANDQPTAAETKVTSSGANTSTAAADQKPSTT